MGTYQSKYTGAEIDALLDVVNEGGGTGGSSYKETELISSPIEYTITSARDWTVLKSNIDFNEDIDKFDELDFVIELGKDNVGYYHTRHSTIKVSDIIYNNSDEVKYDGSHLQIPFGCHTYFSNLGGWFKTPTRFMAFNIGVYNLVNTVVDFTKARIRSIKGIKY